MTARVRKAVFPVAGLGTRFLPATKAMPKEMLTVVDRPLIQHVVDEACAAGIEHFIFVTGRNKGAIEDHFDMQPELEGTLRARGKTAELKLLSEALPEAGGVANFKLMAGPNNANRNYILLGGISGSSPGTPIGSVTIPVNWDVTTDLLVSLINTPIFANFLGNLDSQGEATAQMLLPMVTGAAGLTMTFAYACDKPWNFASNAVMIDIVP